MFWIPWGIDAVIAAIFLYFFAVGLADGSVSSFNSGIWTVTLTGLFAVMGGSLWLKSVGRRRFAMALLLLLAVPGVLFGIFFFALVIANPRWN